MLYVGKAKRLRSRVRSYFAADHDASPKNQCLVRQIADVETIVVANEAQSLLLENNLIKEYQPRFNVRLKDDKSYPSIAVTLGGAVPPRAGDPPPGSSGRPLLRALHRRGAAPARRSRSSAGSTPCAAAPTTSRASAASGPASTTTSAAARPPASAGRRRRTTAR